MYDFIETQLAVWPEARERYHILGKTERRKFKIGDFTGFFQNNPSRITSTAAKVDKASISKRPCFLCKNNRPKVQIGIPLLDKWEMLVNPFPIFPVHFTIVSKTHEPQVAPPIELASLADMYPDLAIFFNGAKAGASAPDHLHLQAVLKTELPLLNLVERVHPASKTMIIGSKEFGIDLPFEFYSAVISPDTYGTRTLLKILQITGIDKAGNLNPGLRNIVTWKDDAGWLRVVVIPRKQHRPSCYGDKEGNFLVSPGTIDMCGIVVLPRRQDFENITDAIMENIYRQI